MILLTLQLPASQVTQRRPRLCLVASNGRRYYAKPERVGSNRHSTAVEAGTVVEGTDDVGQFRAVVLDDGAIVFLTNPEWRALRPLYLAGWRPLPGSEHQGTILRLSNGAQLREIPIRNESRTSRLTTVSLSSQRRGAAA